MGIFSSIGSFLFGGKKKGTSATTSGTTDIDPYAPVVPYLDKYLSQTDALYNGGAPQFSDAEQVGYNMIGNAAGDTHSLNGAIAQNDKTIAGDYLTPDTNPYLADIAKRISGVAGANVNATFGGRGRSSGGLAGYYAGKGVGDSLTDLYGQQYDNERGRQQSAINGAVGLDNQRYVAPQAMVSAGQNISARPFDIAQQQGSVLSQIGRLGQQGTTTGQQQNYVPTNGVVGDIFNSFTNKLFGTTRSTG